MLTWQDCVELSELTGDEIAAIAEHEHITSMAALELGNYLTHTASGEKRIKSMILDDIRDAKASGKADHALALKLVLKNFVEHHPAAR